VKHDPLFDSAWLKWSQAVHHTQTLETEVKARSRDGYSNPLRSFRAEYHAKRHGFLVVAREVEPIPVRWQLLLGDIANNYRSALDHLAWALVTRGRTPPGTLKPRQKKAIYFPIYEDRIEYNRSLAKKLPGVRRADVAKVRGPQPYHYRARATHVLVLLADINPRDKHRTIQPVWAHPAGIDAEILNQRDCVIPRLDWRRFPDPLEVGAKLTYIPARKMGPNPEIDMELRVTTKPSLGDRLGLEEWALRCAHLVAALLVQFSKPPDEVVQVADLPRLMASQTAIGLLLS
jgi:hypothetical protein